MTRFVAIILKLISGLAVFCILVVALALFLKWFSGMPTEHEVKTKFQENFPQYTVVAIFTGDGNDEWVSYYIRYKKANDEKVYESISECIKQPDGNWRLPIIEGNPIN